MPRAIGLCPGDDRTAGLLWRLPQGPGQSGSILIDEVSASEIIHLPVPSNVWDEFVPLLHGHPVFSAGSLLLGRTAMSNLGSGLKKQRHHFDDKGPYNQSYGFSGSHVQM